MTSVVIQGASRVSLIVGVWALFACSSTPTPTKTKATTVAEDALVKMESAAPAEKTVPNYVKQALLNSNGSGDSGPNSVTNIRNRRFDVSVNNVPAKAFFLGLVAEAGVNVVTHPDVEGDITLELSNVTVEEVLNVVRDVYGYEYRIRDEIYTIYSRKIRTEVFAVNYLDIKRVGVSDTHVNIGEPQSRGGGRESSSSSNQSASTGGSADILSMGNEPGEQASSGQGISPGSRVQTLNKTDFWDGIKKTVESIVGGAAEGRMVMVNPQAGLVAVTAMPAELSAVREFLEKSELSVKRQVVLEAQILEVELSEGFQAGVNWSAISGQITAAKNIADGFPVGAAEGAAEGEFRSITTNYTYQDETGVIQNVAIPGAQAIKSTIAGVLQVSDITQLLSLLETQGSVQVLSSPRVSTVNNQKAVIRVGSDEYFVTGLSNSTTSGAATTTSQPEVKLASFFSGISLDVTPQIADDGNVILHIHPIVSTVTDQRKELNVGNSKVSLPLALREVRESDSIVRAHSGQVIVLGGLMQQASKELNGKQPWLGDVPVVNMLFKNKNKMSKKTELVILVRPIVVDENTWHDQLSEFRQSSQRMGDEYRSK